jgi:ubiquinone/menaquinone biosynthesis C-methylase UbiE
MARSSTRQHGSCQYPTFLLLFLFFLFVLLAWNSFTIQQRLTSQQSQTPAQCATAVVAALPGVSAIVGNPSTRDAWMKRAAERTPAGSAVLDVSSGARPYRALWAHCAYQSHEFEGNRDIVDVSRGEDGKLPKNLRSTHDYVGDISATGAPAAFFDVVLLTEVLEHIPQPLRAVAELARVAKPGGDIYITAPFTSGSHQTPYHFAAGYSREFYAYAANLTGLEVVSIESQGDYFKLMAQEISRALTCASIDNAAAAEVEELRATTAGYLLKLSALYGDGVSGASKAWCADVFTIGFMAHLRKPLI